MAGNVVRATLIADSRQFQSGFKKAEKATSGFDKAIDKTAGLAKGLLAGAAAAAVVAFAKDSIRAFSDLEQSTGSVESVFGTAADNITSKARGAAQQFGLSMSEFQNSASTLGAQLKTTLGLSMDEAADKTIDLTEKAADMAATFGGTTAEAISAISSLLRGERDPIERYGVAMNDAAIEAHALEMGLAGTNAELTPQMESAAALDLLMQQTADSTGQFADESETLAGKQQRLNARLENTKALVGQALAPAMSGALDITGSLADVVDELAINFLIAQGAITEAEGALAKWNDEAGDGVTNTEDFFDVLTDFGVNLERIAGGKGGFVDAASSAEDFGKEVTNLLDTLDPGIDTAQEWKDTIEAVGVEQGLTKEQIEAAKDAFDDYVVSEGRAASGAAKHKRDYDGVAGAMGDQAGATEGATDALREQFDLIDGRIGSLENLKTATDEQATAIAEVQRLEDEGKKKTPEWVAAVEAKAEANRNVRDAEIALIESGGLTREEFVKQQVELGSTVEEAQILADKYNELFTPRHVTHTIHFNESGNQSSSGRTYRGGVQQGGYVQANMPVPVGELGPELFVPNQNGRVVANNMLGNWARGAGSGGAVINITINAGLGSDPNAISRAVVEALQRYQRANGSVPIRVRP